MRGLGLVREHALLAVEAPPRNGAVTVRERWISDRLYAERP
jgi:hypothetical protein